MDLGRLAETLLKDRYFESSLSYAFKQLYAQLQLDEVRQEL